MKLTVNRTIDAPRQRVFDLYSDLRGAASNLGGILSLEVLTEGPVAVGTRFCETRVLFGRKSSEVLEVTKFRAPEMFQVECNSHGAHHSSVFSFAELDGATRVMVEFEARPITRFARLMSVFSFMMMGPVKRCTEQDLDDLKRLAESDQVSGA